MDDVKFSKKNREEKNRAIGPVWRLYTVRETERRIQLQILTGSAVSIVLVPFMIIHRLLESFVLHLISKRIRRMKKKKEKNRQTHAFTCDCL